MNSTADVMKYAVGLLDAADSPEQAEELGSELSGLASVLGSHRGLVDTFANPALPLEAKNGLVATLAERAGAPALLKGLLALMVRHGRFKQLGAVADAYRLALAERQGIAHARVRVAKDLGERELGEITRSLSEAVGRRVEVHPELDPSLIGGFVARVGDLVFDGSLARQLEQLRTSLRDV